MNAFQTHLAGLAASISSYEPEQSAASALVADSDQINADIQNLNERLDSLQNNTLQTSSLSSKLSDTMEKILMELGDAKHELDRLPSKKAELNDNLSAENTTQVLAYALKLAKFTKLPKSLNGLVHPNNFIWPADDTLRRGGLAMMNSVGDQVVALENGESLDTLNAAKNEQVDAQNDVKMDSVVEFDDEFLPERRNSFARSVVKPKSDPSTALLGLDLMDSDDDDDDDDDD